MLQLFRPRPEASPTIKWCQRSAICWYKCWNP